MDFLRSLVERFRSGDKRVRLVLATLAGLAALAIGALWPSDVQGDTMPLETKVTNSPIPTMSVTSFVHVTGRVVHPGVYPISPGVRLFEVIALAGGFAAKADKSSVNLARVVEDGEQIFVSPVGAIGALGVQSESSTTLNLNRASATELESLPGVGPKLAGRIVDWRTANGGFAHVADLLEVGGIGDKLYASIKPMVTL